MSSLKTNNSTPSISEFDPRDVPWQWDLIDLIRNKLQYDQVHEILCSGSVGSAKSLAAAHIAVTHCLKFKRARVCLARRSMPDLKETILARVLEHMEGDLIEGIHYIHNETKAKIVFANGSEIISRSWADKKYKKFRSIELSAAVVEELTENNQEDMQAYIELKMRVGRLSHVPEKWIISCTNPDSPAHWAYKYFNIGGL